MAALLTTRNMSKETGTTNSIDYSTGIGNDLLWPYVRHHLLDALIQFGEFLYHTTTSIRVVIDIESIHPK